jgi:hypothetical protein
LIRSLKARDVNWLPWSQCMTVPAVGLRFLTAIPSALVTSEVAWRLSIDQPTTRRE